VKIKRSEPTPDHHADRGGEQSPPIPSRRPRTVAHGWDEGLPDDLLALLTSARSARIERVGRWPARPRGVVLVLHGGRSVGRGRAHPLRLPYLRMWPLARMLDRAGRSAGLATGLVRYRFQGWNGEAMDAFRDVEYVLIELSRSHPQVPVALLGHSMGGRAALRAAGHPSVVAVAALAPWLVDDEPVEQLAGRTVLIAHGDQDRMTDPAQSYAYALRAARVTSRACRFEVHGESHAMLRRRRDWSRLVRHFLLGELGARLPDTGIEAAIELPVPDRLRVGLPAVHR
jgi:pimeloyl-ACP methyl ester carboxylesterase